MVRECCLPDDVVAVLAIKLPVRSCDDFVSCLPEKNGIFSVRLAYILGLQPLIESQSAGHSSSTQLEIGVHGILCGKQRFLKS
jgi:hypothetical protein